MIIGSVWTVIHFYLGIGLWRDYILRNPCTWRFNQLWALETSQQWAGLEQGSCSSRTWLEKKVFCGTSGMEILRREEGTCLQKLGSRDVSVQLLKLQTLVTSSQSNQCCAGSGRFTCLPCTMKWQKGLRNVSVPALPHCKQYYCRDLTPFLRVLLWVGPSTYPCNARCGFN